MERKLTEEPRVESDLIGSREIPASALYGVQTLRGVAAYTTTSALATLSDS